MSWPAGKLMVDEFLGYAAADRQIVAATASSSRPWPNHSHSSLAVPPRDA
jgi:hypothetical protein